jgi:lycopene cyclase domain-containing protein
MTRYLTLNFIFLLGAICIDLFLLRTRVIARRSTWWACVALFILTIIFDNLLTTLPVVIYDHHQILGVFIGHAPIEDFIYSLVAAILAPSLYAYFSRNHA